MQIHVTIRFIETTFQVETISRLQDVPSDTDTWLLSPVGLRTIEFALPQTDFMWRLRAGAFNYSRSHLSIKGKLTSFEGLEGDTLKLKKRLTENI